jgi:hypothetical protein
MKKATFIVTAIVTLFVGICALGGFADDKRGSCQNTLGGKGELKKVVNGRSVLLPPFCDDTNIYFDLQDFSTSGLVSHLYVKNIESSEVQPVCSRPLCTHTTRECPLHFLYPKTFLEYFLLDGKLCFYEVNDDKLVVYSCDVTTDKRTKMCSLPAYKIEKDASGVEVKIEFGVNSIDRINSDTVMIYSGGTAYFYDNSFDLKCRLECGSGCEFAWTDNDVYYAHGKDFYRYDPSENKLYENIISTALGREYVNRSPSLYGYDGKLYFFDDEYICSFDSDKNRVEQLAKADISMGYVLLDGVIYYSKDGKINAYTIQTKQVRAIEKLPAVPLGAVGERLIVWTENGYDLYTKDGEKL